jgi:CBS domain-containing protein
MNFIGKDLETTPHARHAREMKVRDVMTKEVVCVHSGSALTAAATLMDTNRVKRLIVTDDERGVRGVVSRADLIRLYAMK